MKLILKKQPDCPPPVFQIELTWQELVDVVQAMRFGTDALYRQEREMMGDGNSSRFQRWDTLVTEIGNLK